MTDPAAPFAILPDGADAWLAFAAPDARDAVSDPEALPAWWNRLARQRPGWRIVYLSFEAGLANLGLPVPATRPGPLAAVWTCAPPVAAPTPPLPPSCSWTPEWNESQHADAVRDLVGAIEAGEIYQANLTFRMRGQDPTQPVATGAIANAPTPPWSAFLADRELRLWSRSPECFLRIDGPRRRVVTAPIKGTADRRGFDALAASEKERAEHVMIVDMARNDLGRVAVAGGVHVAPMFAALDVGYAVHAVSDVHAELTPDWSPAELLAATVPAASISGTPKRRACEWIAQREASPRGPYTGVLGWLAPDNSGAFSVLIRTVWHDAAGWGYGTGGGIVADSDPAAEYAEALLKTRALDPPESSA